MVFETFEKKCYSIHFLSFVFSKIHLLKVNQLKNLRQKIVLISSELFQCVLLEKKK